MTAEELLTYLAHQGIELWIDGDNLRYRGPRITLPPGLVALLRQHKVRLRELLLMNRQSFRDLVPLSYTQKSMWFLHQLNPSSTAYNVHFAARLKGPFSAPALKAALDKLGARHSALRIRYVVRDGLPWQTVEATPSIPLTELDASGWTGSELTERIRADAYRPYDLLGEPPARVHLYQRSPTEQILLIGMHHIRVDGWSMAILLRELGVLYQSELSGRPAQLPPLGTSFSDFIAWQQWLVQGADGSAQLAYWMKELGGELAPLDLPTDRPRPPVRSERGAELTWSLDAASSQRLKSLAAREGSTAFSLLLSAFAALLHRYTGQEEILIGIPYHGRSASRWNDVIGCLINTIVLRVHPRGEQSFASLLREVHKQANEALAHADYPFPLLVERLRPERDLSRMPLFQVLFAYENFQGIDAMSSLLAPKEGAQGGELFGLATEPIPLAQQEGQFDLTLRILEDGTSFCGSFCFSTDLFERETAEQMLAHFDLLLQSALASPGGPISHLELLSEEERHRILIEWNRTEADYPKDRSIVDLFEAHAQQTPEATALVCGSQRLSYRELDLRANQLAQLLRSLGVGSEALVGLCMDRSFEMVVALLGILKAGAAYVPLDQALPIGRISNVLSDAGISLLLTRSSLLARLPVQGVRFLCPFEAEGGDGAPAALSAQPTSKIPLSVPPESLAYVIYTSGSTGRPKGVMIPHRGLINYLWWCQTAYPVTAEQGAPVHSTLSFDLTVTSLWAPLLAGRPVHLLPEGSEVDALKNALLQHQDYGLVKLTPAHLELLNHQIPPQDAAGKTRSFVIGGENLLASQVSFWRDNAPDTLLFNEYGPTETVVGCCVYQIKKEDPRDGAVPIGRPIANTKLYVLDDRSAPVPVGIRGELFIGGVGVGRGYLNQPELSAQRFVPDPFSAEPGARMYQTGDLCRYRRDGNLEFLGRLDQQVKLRGYRIELSEIESVLASHPSISSCCVLLREDAPGDKRLIAYVVSSASPAPDSLSLAAHLATCLPHYMVPAAFVRLDSLPLTSNGKLDRRALPPPYFEESEKEVLDPSSPIEQLLAEVFREVLRREHIPLSASFFDLGGHSLLAMQLVSRIRKLCEVELPVQAVFESPSITALAERVRAALAGGLSPLPPVRPLGLRTQVRMSFTQQRLWLLQALDPGSCTYNVPMQWRLSGALDVAVLQRCLDALAERHEVLRARVESDTREPLLQIMPHGRWPLQQAEVRSAAEAERVLREQARRPFVLKAEPPVRAVLVRLSDSEHWLQLSVHHMAFDGWSHPILLRELSSLYAAGCSGGAAELPALELQYSDYAEAQRGWLASGVRTRQLSYWRQVLTPLPAPLELPTDRPRPGRSSGAGARISVELDEKTTAALKDMCRREGVTPFMALLSAYAITLHRYAGQEDFAIGTPIAGRTHVEVERLIGCFINTLVLRIDLSGAPSYQEVLRRVKDKALGAYAHAELPFEVLVEELNPPRDTGRSPLFQAMFLLQSTQHEELTLSGLRSAELPVDGATAKFDLALSMEVSKSRILGTLEYSTDLFDSDTIERLGRHFLNIVQAALATPQKAISRLDLLSEEEHRRLLFSWNPPPPPSQQDDTFPSRFLAQVARTPDSLAVQFGEETLTYRQLSERAAQLAHAIQEAGVGPERRVALYLDRSLQLVIGIVGIWLSGGTYVPLDPQLPAERLRYQLQDSATAVLLTQRRYSGALKSPGLKEVFVDDESLAARPCSPPPLALLPRHLAYCIYTSGSTGRPRGVLVEHGSLVHLARTLQAALLPASVPPLRATLTANLVFDASIKMLALLLRGDSLHVVPAAVRADAALFVEWSRAHHIHLIDCTPSLLTEFFRYGLLSQPDYAPDWLWIGGEALSEKLWVQLQQAPRTRSINLYGPTECTVDSTICEIGTAPERPVIGKPFGNIRVYILDAHRGAVPVGVFGELYLGGPGVARGYLNQPELTAEKFLPDPFHPGERMYRTGDSGRWLPDGNIEFQGRLDFQVKLRGFRIELGEIESVLSSHSAVKSCAVLLREDAPGSQRLCAYIAQTPGAAPEPSELREYLGSKLPSYMIPSVFVFLESLPVNTNGKVDRRSLPPPSAAPGVGGYVAPRTSSETLLATAFAQVLGLPRAGIHDSFFDLGGHSLLAVRLIAEISRLTGQSIPLSILFEHQTVAELAQELEKESALRPHKTLVLLNPAESSTPLFFVHPVGGHVLCYVELASSFLPPQKVYGVQATPVAQAPVEETLSEVASRYVTAIRSVQPHGPYQLLGWSLGGVLAFEMARQLKLAGEEIPLLVLLDAYAPDANWPQEGAAYSEAEVQRWFLMNLTGERLSKSDAEPLPEDVARLRRALDHGPSAASSLEDRYEAQLAALYALFRRNIQMERGYRPDSYDGQILLLRAAERPTARSRDCGWAALCTGELEIVDVPGDHYTLLSPANVPGLTRLLEGRFIGMKGSPK